MAQRSCRYSCGTTFAMHVTVERLLIDIEDLKTSFSVSKRMQGDLTLGELGSV